MYTNQIKVETDKIQKALFNQNEGECIKLLKEFDDAYYNDSSIIPDDVYDDFRENVKSMFPSNSYFGTVGSEVKGKKVKHDFPMLSLDKVKIVEDLVKWLNKIIDKRVELVAEFKHDGLSCSIIYEDGNLKRIATRGDGEIGQDITHIINYIQDIPKIISPKGKVEVRGELQLPKNTTINNPDNKPLRNIAVGLINRKDSGLGDLNHLHFIAYQIYGVNRYTESDKIDFLKENNFRTFEVKTFWTVTDLNKYYEEYLDHIREEYEYETDGLVIVVNDCSLHDEINNKYVVDRYPHHAISWKPPAESKDTILRDIEWNVSRNGNLIPVAIFDPIILGGSEIKRATLNNYETVIKLELHKEDIIRISKNNEVIPFFSQVVIPNIVNLTGDLIPPNCPSCNFILGVQGIHLHCSNINCPERNIQLITHFVKECEMDGVSESTVRLLYDEGFIKSIIDLYSIEKINEDFLLEVDGFGRSKLDNLIKQIDKNKKMTIVQLLSRLGIPLVGEKAIKKLGIKTKDNFWSFNDETQVIGKNLIEYRNKNKKFLEDLFSVIEIEEVRVKKSKGKVCMTGKGPVGRKEIISIIEDKGYEFVDSVNAETNILLCDDPDGNSSKIKKAKILKTKIMKYEDFLKNT